MLHFFVYTCGYPINTKVMLTIDNIWRSTQRSLDDSTCPICDAIKCSSVSFLFLESRCRIIFVKPCPIASTASTPTRSIFLLLEHDRVVLKFVHFHWYTIAADWNSVISDLWRPVARILHHGTFDSVFHDGRHTGHPQSGRCSDVWELMFQTCMVKSVAAKQKSRFVNQTEIPDGAAGLQDYIRFHCYGQDITFNAWHLRTGLCSTLAIVMTMWGVACEWCRMYKCLVRICLVLLGNMS